MGGNVIREIAVKNLKASKKSNIVLGIAIAIVAAFLTAILIFSYSMNDMVKQDLVKSGFGKYEAMLFAKDNNELEDIKKHAKVQMAGESIINSNPMSIGEDKIYSQYSDEIALELMASKIVEGHLAIDKFDIVLDKEFTKKNNIKIGDNVTTNEGETFKVTGISEDQQNEQTNNSYSAYVSREKALQSIKEVNDEAVDLKNVRTSIFITAKDKWNKEAALKNIAEDLGYEIDKDFFINEEMLGVSVEAIASFVILAIIIMLSSFFIIYNLVSINFIDRVKNYGLLVTMGTSKKQLKMLMWWEVFILSIISIPLGIIVGVFAGKVIIPMIPVNIELVPSYRTWFIPVVFILTLFIVFISIIGPVKQSTKLSPIEATRYTGDNNVKRVKVKQSKNVFTDLAKINIWRNKRATLTIIISLTLSSLLFLVVSTLLTSMNLDNYVRSYFVSQDVKVSLKNELEFENNSISNSLLEQISKISSVSNVNSNKMVAGKVNNQAFDIFSLNKKDFDTMKDNLVEGSLNIEDYKDNNKAIIRVFDKGTNNLYKVNDKVKVVVDGKEKEVEIGAIIDDLPFKKDSESSTEMLIFEDNDIFNNIENNIVVELDVNGNNVDTVKNEILNLVKLNNNIEVTTFDEVIKLQGDELKAINIIGYLILGIVGLIGVLNYVVTILTSVASRKREFGLIRALGVKEKELRKMVIKEGLYLSGIITIVGITLGNILGYVLYLMFKTEATYAIYTFPIVQNIMLIIILFIVPLTMYNIAVKKIIKQTVVEQIKYSE